MKFVGKIEDIIFNGRFIVQTSFKPHIGATLVDKHKRTLGKISQIIGPVKKPYLIIAPSKDVKPSFKLIGNDVYLL